jgi:hypothetical protein
MPAPATLLAFALAAGVLVAIPTGCIYLDLAAAATFVPSERRRS